MEAYINMDKDKWRGTVDEYWKVSLSGGVVGYRLWLMLFCARHFV